MMGPARFQGPLSLQNGVLPASREGVKKRARGRDPVPGGGVRRDRRSPSRQRSPWRGPRPPSGSREGSEAGRLGSEKWDRKRFLATSLHFLGHREKVKGTGQPGQPSRQRPGLETGHPGDQEPHRQALQRRGLGRRASHSSTGVLRGMALIRRTPSPESADLAPGPPGLLTGGIQRSHGT